MDLDSCEVDDKSEKRERGDEQFVSCLADDARAEAIARATHGCETHHKNATEADLCEKTQSGADSCENAKDLLPALCETPKKKRKRRKRKKKAGELTASDDVNCDVTDDCGVLSTISDTGKRNEDRSVNVENVEVRGDDHENQNEAGSKKKRRSRSRRKKKSGQLLNEEVEEIELDTMANGETSRSNLSEFNVTDEKRNMASSPKVASSGKKTPNGRGRSTEPHIERKNDQDESDEGVKPNTFRPRERSTTPGNASHRTPKSSTKRKRPLYEHYWSLEKVSEGLKKGELVKGVLRISPRNYEMAWVTVPGLKRDLLLEGMLRRNRSLNGDVVALQILPKDKWKVMKDELDYNGVAIGTPDPDQHSVAMVTEEIHSMSLQSPGKAASPHTNDHIDNNEVPEQYLQRTGKVVFIIEKKHSRVACGHLKPFPHPKESPDGLFSPIDSRLPRLRIPRELCPPGFFDRPQDFEKTLLVARITSWSEASSRDSFLATGSIARSLGEAGEIEPETEGILLEYGIDSGPFSDEALACLPGESPWRIPESELASRRDFRGECVFTIDPLTARDLDDAVHCKKLEDGVFEVGVHIADISYFVRPGSALDEAAAERATSTYMVQKVVPMLPRRLCEELCSLKPGEDRLTFSVVWKMSEKGEILDEWKGRGIIRSRVQMAYEHAQDMIDKPKRVWRENELPPILDGGVTAEEISSQVNQLHKFAVSLRRRRFENGALRLNQAKLKFDIDKVTGLPSGYYVHQQHDANKLIEEFMLLANIAVAHHIYAAYPDVALLRRHPKPHSKQLDDLVELCKSFGIQFNGTSSKTIQESLAKFPLSSPEHEVLVNLTMRPMKNAEYFCTGCVEEDKYEHFALSVPLYTHFTSPIRRYPDLVVHRLLAASLSIDQPLNKEAEEIDMIADHCNDRKLAAKRASELSNEMFFGIFVRECGPLEEDGVVVSVMDQSFDVLLPAVGMVKRVYCKFCPGVKSFEFTKGERGKPAELSLYWSFKSESTGQIHEQQQVLKVFSQVRVQLTTESETKNQHPFKINPKLVLPKPVDQSYLPSTPNKHEGGMSNIPNPTEDVRKRLFESEEEDKESDNSDDVIVEEEENDGAE